MVSVKTREATLLPISTLTSVSDGHPTDLGTFSLPPSPAQSIHRYPLPTHISPVLRSHSVWAGISGKCGYYDGVPSLSSNSAVRTHCACPRALLRRTSGGRRGTTGHSFFHVGTSTGFFPLDRACSSDARATASEPVWKPAVDRARRAYHCIIRCQKRWDWGRMKSPLSLRCSVCGPSHLRSSFSLTVQWCVARRALTTCLQGKSRLSFLCGIHGKLVRELYVYRSPCKNATYQLRAGKRS